MQTMKYCLFLVLFLYAATGKGQSNLVGYWSFDSGATDTIVDETPNENHGINFGAKPVDSPRGKAMTFDGSKDYIQISEEGGTPSVLRDLGKGSISLWFKVDHIPTDYGIAPLLYYGMKGKCDFFDAANKGLIIELGHSPVQHRSERLYFTIWKNGCTYPSFCYDSGGAIEEGKWYHFVAIVGEDFNTGYLNGVEMDNRRYNFGTPDYSQFFADALAHERMWLGKGHWDRTTQFYDGAIDELRIYDKALNADEVKALYNGTVSSSEEIQGHSDAPVKIYPNPATRHLYYEFAETANSPKEIRMTDQTGQVVLRKTDIARKSSIDTSGLPAGMYHIAFHTDKKSYKKKVLIAR